MALEMKTRTGSYHARIAAVVAFIDAHQDKALTVELLCDVAGFSKFHFHRQFTKLLGTSVGKYVQLLRLKRAAFRLAYRVDEPVLAIALEAGYEGPEAFSRAFKAITSQAPRDFRRAPEWSAWKHTYEPIAQTRIAYMKSMHISDVEIFDFPETRLAVLEHRGDHARLGDSLRRFIAWRKDAGLSPKRSATFNLLYNDPDDTPPEDFKLDVCVATDRDITANVAGIIAKVIPAGRCASLRYTGPSEGLGEALKYLYAEWLPQSGEELRDFPLFCRRVTFFPDVPEHEAITDIYLPLR